MFSNSISPPYYSRFRELVISGEIPVCNEISLEMNRIDALIQNPKYWFDTEAIDGFVAFCEEELTLTDGGDLKLLDSFKLWAESLLGWYYAVDRSIYIPGPRGGHYETRKIWRRLTNKQYLIVARGSAKSMYLSCIQSYFLTVNTTTTHQITTAPTMKQAEEVLSPIRTSITRARGPLYKFLTEGSLQNTTGSRAKRVKLASTKKGIENFLNSSILEVRPMSIAKLQGLRPFVCTIDEWLSGDTREDVIGALEQGASKLEEYIIVAASSEGTTRNGPGDTIKMELLDILNGKYHNPHVSIWYYRLDSLDEIPNPAMWVKANPNLGLTISYETIQLDVERAENSPATRNDIIAKRFCIPVEGLTYFFTYEETLPQGKPRDFWNMPCSLGIDLSLGDDFCSFTFLFPLPRNMFGIKTLCFITELTMTKLPGALRYKYEEFLKEGSLRVMPGKILSDNEVYDEVDKFILDTGYDVRTLGYDPYNATTFISRWEKENGSHGVVKVPQGVRTESVPLGELKTLAGEGSLLFDENLVTFCMGNAVAKEDTNGNRKLVKTRYDEKIDVVSALMDAYVAYKAFPQNF